MSQSTLLWIALSFATLDFTLYCLNPLQYIHTFAYMPLSRNPLVSKIPQFLHSSEDPEVLIMGCSLPQMSVAFYDADRFNSVDSSDIQMMRQYTKALYLEELLKKKIKKNLHVFNLTSSGAMASDEASILKKLLEFDKHPRVIVFGIGPRTFFDNTYPRKTAVTEILEKQRTLKDLYRADLSWEERREILLGYLSNFYRERSDYRNFLVKYICNKANREPSIYLVQQKFAAQEALGSERDQPAITTTTGIATTTFGLLKNQEGKGHQNPRAFNADLALYNMRYNPPDFERFDFELSGLKTLLETCRKAKIKILVVDMPRTNANEALLDKQILMRYRNDIPRLVKSFEEASYLNLNDGRTCNIEDFIDSVHCNSSGGKKVQDRLAEHISGKNWM